MRTPINDTAIFYSVTLGTSGLLLRALLKRVSMDPRQLQQTACAIHRMHATVALMGNDGTDQRKKSRSLLRKTETS